MEISRYSESSGTYTANTLLSGLTATKDEKLTTIQVFDIDVGTIVVKAHTFWFEALAGEDLPVIAERDVLLDCVDPLVKYEVLGIGKQGGEENRLQVVTRRHTIAV